MLKDEGVMLTLIGKHNNDAKWAKALDAVLEYFETFGIGRGPDVDGDVLARVQRGITMVLRMPPQGCLEYLTLRDCLIETCVQNHM